LAGMAGLPAEGRRGVRNCKPMPGLIISTLNVF